MTGVGSTEPAKSGGAGLAGAGAEPDLWSDRADEYRKSPIHAAGEDLDLVVEWCEPGPGVTVLDVATGGGHVAYTFAPHVQLLVDASGGNLSVTALDRAVFDFPPGVVTQLVPASNTEFYFNRGQRTRLSFITGADGTVTGVIVNPGPWAQRGTRVPD